MSVQTFSSSIIIHRPVRDVFAWHELPGALERLTPPWEQVEVLPPFRGIRNGSRVQLRSKIGPIWQTWRVRHRDYDETRSFCDEMERGPFASWRHEHRFKLEGPAECTLTDSIEYKLPFGPLGSLAAGYAQKRLERLFAYRHAVLAADMRMAADYGAVRGMRFLVTGASGLIGRALVPFLRSQGHEVVRLVRGRTKGADTLAWDPECGELDLSRQRPFDVVIHLAGENVASGRWTAGRRERIKRSRVQGTRVLVTALEKLRHRPFVFISASAVGFYGDAADRELHEGDRKGSGFLAAVCDAWEKEAAAARGFGIRVAKLRFGVVLSPAGGALAKMLPAFRWGCGGVIGSGRQWMSWISVDDALGAIYHAVLDQRCNCPINVVSPEPVTNREFAATLARVLRRPALMPVPAPALRFAFGGMANETLLASQRVLPEMLLDTRYRFRYPRLEEALRHVLGRTA